MDTKKKVMLSQPMRGFSEEEIKATKEKAVKKLEENGYELINSLFDSEWDESDKIEERGYKQIPVYFLAKSIRVMSQCDAVYFCKGWENARGCVIEHEIAEKYGLEVIEEE